MWGEWAGEDGAGPASKLASKQHATAWAKELRAIQQSLAKPRTIIGVFGSTGERQLPCCCMSSHRMLDCCMDHWMLGAPPGRTGVTKAPASRKRWYAMGQKSGLLSSRVHAHEHDHHVSWRHVNALPPTWCLVSLTHAGTAPSCSHASIRP